jgi:hypothetical protein
MASRKTATVVDGRLETNVRPTSSGMAARDLHEVLRRPSVEKVPTVLRYCVGFSTALAPQLQLWHIHWLVSVESVGELRARVPQVVHFLSHEEDGVSIVETRQRFDNAVRDSARRTPVQQHQLAYCGYRGIRARLSILHAYIPYSFNHKRPLLCTELLQAHNNVLCIVVINTTAEKLPHLIDH